MNFSFVFEDGCGGSFLKDFRCYGEYRNGVDNIPASKIMQEVLPKIAYDKWIDGAFVLCDHTEKTVIDPDKNLETSMSSGIHLLRVYDSDIRDRALHAFEKYWEDKKAPVICSLDPNCGNNDYMYPNKYEKLSVVEINNMPSDSWDGDIIDVKKRVYDGL